MRKVEQFEQKVESFAVMRADCKQITEAVVNTADMAVAVGDLSLAKLQVKR